MELDAPVQEEGLDDLLKSLDSQQAGLDQQIAEQGAGAPDPEFEPEQTADGEQKDDGTRPSDTDKPQAAATAPGDKGKEATPDKTKAGTQEKSVEGQGVEGKEAKTEQREKKVLSGFEAKRQAFRTEQESFKREREQFAQERQKFDEERTKAKDAAPEFTPEDYDKAAEHFEKEGKLDLAEAARENAKQLRSMPPEQRAEVQFKSAQQSSWLKATERLPELKVTGSETQKKFKAFIDAHEDLFTSTPRAFEFAAEILSVQGELEKTKTDASRVPDLEKQVQELTAKVEELTLATTPSGGGAGRVTTEEKSLDDMSPAERGDYLRRIGEEADR